eukprot:TRINITY_DN3336_c0_g1_i1.p1 TRINITY_DN3336_c0_g1~~TRINITY_DN3336_c0_g1_i1.p1  ORF type:complete len:169 (-),score=17.65 TRINITY_DN3336_c0_g1_i1:32-538(-)
MISQHEFETYVFLAARKDSATNSLKEIAAVVKNQDGTATALRSAIQNDVSVNSKEFFQQLEQYASKTAITVTSGDDLLKKTISPFCVQQGISIPHFFSKSVSLKKAFPAFYCKKKSSRIIDMLKDLQLEPIGKIAFSQEEGQNAVLSTYEMVQDGCLLARYADALEIS